MKTIQQNYVQFLIDVLDSIEIKLFHNPQF